MKVFSFISTRKDYYRKNLIWDVLINSLHPFIIFLLLFFFYKNQFHTFLD